MYWNTYKKGWYIYKLLIRSASNLEFAIGKNVIEDLFKLNCSEKDGRERHSREDDE